MSSARRPPLKRVFSLRIADWMDMARAFNALIAALWLVRTRPQGQLVETASHPKNDNTTFSQPVPEALANRFALAVDRVASYGPFVGPLRPACLARAIALNRMLERHDVHGSVVRVGVRRIGAHFDAHAWVELNDRVLGDREEHVRSFTALADMRVMQTS